MLATLVATLGSKLLSGLYGTVDEMVEDKDLALKLKTALQTKLMSILDTEIKAARDIIVAEIKSDSYLAKNWRPLTMLVFVAIIFNNYLLHPYISLFFEDHSIKLDIPPDMWDLLKIGIGGYVVGRSVEKGVKIYKGKDNE